MRKLVHAGAGTGALLLVCSFWLSTVASELSGSEAAVVAVKTAIPYALPLMVILMAAAGGTGFAMAPGATLGRVGAKRRRMPFIALNGVLVLIPCALFLAWRAEAALFDTAFQVVQTIELVAGAVNATLLGLNLRDGLALSRRGRPGTPAAGTPPIRS